MRCPLLSLICICLFFSCSEPKTEQHAGPRQLIRGRDQQPIDGSLERAPIYQMQVPDSWRRIDPDPNESIYDTREALVTFKIPSPHGESTMVIHNFPNNALDEQIPAQAQVTRWLQQFSKLDPTKTQVIPQSFSGFEGLRVEAAGEFKGSQQALIGWGLVLASQHHRTLSRPSCKIASTTEKRQMRGDVTIKVTGPIPAVQENREQIIRAARSFELLLAIPESQ